MKVGLLNLGPFSLGYLKFFRAATRTKCALEAQTHGRFDRPLLVAIGLPTLDAQAQAVQFGLRLRLVDQLQPIPRLGHGPRAQYLEQLSVVLLTPP